MSALPRQQEILHFCFHILLSDLSRIFFHWKNQGVQRGKREGAVSKMQCNAQKNRLDIDFWKLMKLYTLYRY